MALSSTAGSLGLDVAARAGLVVEDLSVWANTREGAVPLLQEIDLEIHEGEVTCIIGPSGSGKSTLLRALLGVLPVDPGVTSGRICRVMADGREQELLEGLDTAISRVGGGRWLVKDTWKRLFRGRMERVWGRWLGYAPQHGNLALDPTLTVEKLLREAFLARDDLEATQPSVYGRILELLEALHFDVFEEALRLRPAELSGGMAQRVSLAVAIARGGQLLFVDEPTAGLDAQATGSLVRLLQHLRTEGLLHSLVVVSHDMDLASRLADRVYVLAEGFCVDRFTRAELSASKHERHPVAREMMVQHQRLASVPRVLSTRPKGERTPVLQVQGLKKSFRGRRGWHSSPAIKVLDDVNLELYPGEIVGLMGPSGVGKTTLARCISGGLRPERGVLRILGKQPAALRRSGEAWRLVQLLFQPVEAFIHPMMSVEEALLETARVVLAMNPKQAGEAVEAALVQVGLEPRRNAYPATLSGGELRRVGVARVLMIQPALLVADEPTACVDPFLRAGILDLLRDLACGPTHTAILLISHDVDAVFYASDRVFRLEDGRLQRIESRSDT